MRFTFVCSPRRRARHRSCRLALLALAGLLIAAIGSDHQAVRSRQSSAAMPQAIEAYYGQSDQELLRALPALELKQLLQFDPPHPPPAIRFAPVPPGMQAPQRAAAPPEMDEVLPAQQLPDTLLLFSGDWFGPKLRQAVDAMGLSLTAEQIRTLEAVAVTRAVNTRLLLALAAVKDTPRHYSTPQDWLKWLYLEASRARAALGPFSADDVQVIAFADGRHAALLPGQTNTAAWALTTMLGAGRTVAETSQALAQFSQLYSTYFGDPAVDEAQPAAATPFLSKPYRVQLDGRGYYDHTYPSVDNGKSPNVAGMRDYLGRSYTSYDTHDGDDFTMSYGSAIYAPVSGTVLWKGDVSSSDRALLIRNDSNTYDIIIAHMSEVYPNLYQSVSQGDLIGKSGQPAYSNPHIHFEVRHNGKQTDTMGWYGGGSDPCPAGPGPSGSYKGCEASVWLWADEQPPTAGCTDAVEVGAWSSRQQAFVDAYNRNGGTASLGCTATGTEWWTGVVRQDFTGGGQDVALIHDELRDDPATPAGTLPAYAVRGPIWSYYETALGGATSWLGPPTSDQFTNRWGLQQSNFGGGYIVWNGSTAQAHPWPVGSGGWQAAYHNGGTLASYPTWVQNQPAIGCRWGAAAPGNGAWGVWPDTFMARYTRRVFLPAGSYTFIAGADDGIRVWVDDFLLIDEWRDQGYTEYQATRWLATGYHDLRVEYYEKGGDAAVSFNWRRSFAPVYPHRVFIPLVRGAGSGSLC